MSALGTMMQRAGLLSQSQVAAAQEHAAANEMPLVEAIVELGLGDEDAVVAFSASKLMLPRVGEKVLERVETQTLGLLTPALAWTHRAVPVAIDATGNLTVAFMDPTSTPSVHAIAEHTGKYIIRGAAKMTPLRTALTRYYGAADEVALDMGSTQPALDIELKRRTPPRMPEAPVRRPPPMSPSVLEEAQRAAPPPRAPAPRPSPPPTPRADLPLSSRPPSWNPPLSGHGAEPVPLSPEALERFLPKLRAADSRDTITSAVLDYLVAGFHHVILFVHTRGELRGHDARGPNLLVDAVRLVRIPDQGRSMFAKALENQRAVFGPMGHSAIDRALSQALGGVAGNVLVLPVVLGSKVPLLVFAHGARNPVDPASINTLAEETGHALHRLILRSKS